MSDIKQEVEKISSANSESFNRRDAASLRYTRTVACTSSPQAPGRLTAPGLSLAPQWNIDLRAARAAT